MRRLTLLFAGVMLAGVTVSGALSGTAGPGFGTPAQAHAAGSRPVAPAPVCDQQVRAGKQQEEIPYAQHTLGAERVWPLSTGSGVTVAVLDSGVDVSHPQLRGANIDSGTDVLRGKGNGRYDCVGHGTAVASLIVAQKVRGVGFQGLAYDARLLPVIVGEPGNGSSDEATVTPARLAKAINWAVSHHADVINLSLPLYQDHPAVSRAIDRATANNVVVVAAVGDEATPADPDRGIRANPGRTPYPAMRTSVIGVSAVTAGTRPLGTSPWGEHIDLVAPGQGVLAAAPRGGHTGVQGSAFAAAFVSAAAALVRAKWPDISARDVARRLFATADPAAGPRKKVGHGIVNPYRALTESLSDEEPAELSGAAIPSADPASLERAQEWASSGTISLIVVGVGMTLAGLMVATLTLLPKGIRRGWRPGQAKGFPEPPSPDDDLPPAPVKLFEDLEVK